MGLGQGRPPDCPHFDFAGILWAVGSPFNQLLGMETSRMPHRTQEYETRRVIWDAWKNYEDWSNFGYRKDEGNSRGLLAHRWPDLGVL